MGLITGAAARCPLAPVRGVLWVVRAISEEVDAEQEPRSCSALDEVEAAKERGEIGEQEAAERQDEMLDDVLRGGDEP